MAYAFTVSLDPKGPSALHAQLYARLRQAILDGRLRPGERMPATRALAAQLAISRTTTVLAYEQLLAEGYVEARRGAGTFVSRQVPDEALRAPSDRTGPRSESSPPPRRLSRWGDRVRALDEPSPQTAERFEPLPYDFRPGRPDWGAFPHRIWSRLAARRWRERSADLASYGEPGGYRPLREAIARHLGHSRGVRCDAEQVVVVNGSQQGIDLLIRLWLDPGQTAAVEAPGYPGAALALTAHGARQIPIAVDGDGLDVGQLPRPDGPDVPRLVYVTPSHQFPTGATLSLPRRFQLLEWATRVGALVVEDDYDSEFRYAGRPLESLQGLDRAGVVAYVGSFSKALFPPLRVGFVVVPDDMAGPFVAAKWLADRQTATPEQQVLSDFIQEGHFERHLRRMRRLYQARREALLDALGRELAGVVTPGGDGAGLHLVAWLAAGLDARAIAEQAASLGVATSPISDRSYDGTSREGLLLGFAALDEDRIRAGVKHLARAAEQVRSCHSDDASEATVSWSGESRASLALPAVRGSRRERTPALATGARARPPE
jgi:GntR family transcriptional regulator/MocR family aminotransferase